MYINHLTLSTGHAGRIRRGDVRGEALARVAPWLAALVESGKSSPLPTAELAHYTAQPCVLNGSLLVTISGPPADGGKAPPLVTMGVAKRSRHGAALWPLLTAPTMPPAKPGTQRPASPWAGIVIWPTLMMFPAASEWLGDLERCIAWAWVTRPSEQEQDPS